MKKLLTIAISISLLIGCNNKSEQEYQKEGNAILAACVKKMIGTGDKAKVWYKLLPPGFPPGLSKKEIDEWIKREDSVKKRMLSINPYIVAKGPERLLKKEEKEEKYGYGDSMVNIMHKKGYEKLEYREIFTIVDTPYLMQQLGLMVTDKERWEKGEELHYEEDRFIAVFDFESIKYNAERQVAIVDGGVWCGGKCGYDYYMLLEKKGAVWEVIYFTKISES